MTATYIITGGEGFIGSTISRETNGISYDLKSGLDILNTSQLENFIETLGQAANKLSTDSQNAPSALTSPLVTNAPAHTLSGIFHCAAKISVPESVAQPGDYYRTNVQGTQSVVQVAENNGLKIVFSSSAAVYGEATTPVAEIAQLTPKSPYAQNKLDGERLLANCAQSTNSTHKHIALRYFNVYGPRQSPQYAGVITHFIRNALQNKDLIIYGDGKQVRDFVYVDDIARANILAMNYANPAFDVFNVGSGKETTITELAETIIRLTNSTSKIRYEAAREGDIIYSCADISKISHILGWKPQVSLETGLKATIEYYKDSQ